MRCLFCKLDSSASCSVEHIIPESLGNLSHTLPVGVVCDGCNNYLAREVEKPFLECAAMTLLRFHQEVPSKKGRVPPATAILAPGIPAVVRRHPKSEFRASVELPPTAIDQILRAKKGTLILPAEAHLPAGPVVSRFLAKVALEAMAQRLLEQTEGLAYLVAETQLDSIRYHARRCDIQEWPFHSRRIYDTNAKWFDETGAEVQLVHEFDILKTDWDEWFFVLVLFGLELVINYGGPEIDGYSRWLREHDQISPLYWGKNAERPRVRPG